MFYEIEANNYYYTQAAGTGKEENPFLVDDAGTLLGDNSMIMVAGPPSRPPPPKFSPAKSIAGGLKTVEQMGQQHEHNVARMMYSSSSYQQQHEFAPSLHSQTMHSSPVKGNVKNVSSINGGGS